MDATLFYQIIGTEIVMGHALAAGGFFYSLSEGDMNGAACTYLQAFFFPALPPRILAVPIRSLFDDYKRRLQ